MGNLFFFDETVSFRNEDGKASKSQVEVGEFFDTTPYVRIGPEGENQAYRGVTVHFEDWKQFERFVEAVDDVYSRLRGSR